MPLSDALGTPEIYFDPPGNCYYVKNTRGTYIQMRESSLKTKLKDEGFSHETEGDEPLSEVDAVMNEVRHDKDVDYAGPLAGYPAGVYEIQTRRVLVTEGPRLIEPEPGPWPTIRALLQGLLMPDVSPDQDCEWGVESQLWVFYSWLKVAISSLRAGRRRPGQAMVIAGPPACGKSLVQNLITKLLGGRSAKPYQFLSGGTQFNSDLFTAEHLMIEDETASFDLKTRRQLGANLKGFVVNESHRCHPKNRPALTLLPFWRVSITLNDEAEDLIVLPPIDESLADKMILFRAYKREMPMQTETLEQWAAFTHLLNAELPGFVYFLLNEWQVPNDLRCDRYGVQHFHHPELLDMMNVLAPETKLLDLIDQKLFAHSETVAHEA